MGGVLSKTAIGLTFLHRISILTRMIPRLLEKKIRTLCAQFPIITLVGPRQAGKSTLAKMAFPSHAYVSLENPALLSRALDDPLEFLTQYPQGVIIDEAQRAPQLFSYLQEIVDTEKKMGHYILTGSQNFLLFSKISQSLAGRVGLITLLPFSISELPTPLPKLNTLLWQGCYPPLYDRNIPAPDWYQSYIQTYIERDVRQSINIQDLHTFHRFLRLCAGRVGQLINFTDLANDVGISRNTVKAWLSVLEASYIIYFLNPYHENFSKRVIKQSKLYFYDTGLAASLLEIHKPDDINTHFARGPLFENLIVSEVYKAFSNQGRIPKLSFWRDHSGKEVDLIIESGTTLSIIEMKSGLTVTASQLSQLTYFKTLVPPDQIRQAYLVYGGDEAYKWKDIHVTGWQQAITQITENL